MEYLLVFVLSICAMSAMGQTSDRELPQTWEKDFVVTLSYSGSMDGSATKISITYDSCEYFKQSGMKESGNATYAMTDADRREMLKKLHELKVDEIKSEIKPVVVHDGYSSTLCFGSHCVAGGTSANLSNHDKEQFALAYDYIEDFAAKRAVLKKKVSGADKKKNKN